MAKSVKNREGVIEVLNRARADELAAIHQYMSMHYELDAHDYGPLAADVKLIAIDEMRHAEMLAERIHVIGGVPTSKPSSEVQKGLPVRETFKLLVELEEAAVRDYNEFYNVCLERRDSLSAQLFQTIIDEEQVHYNYFDNVGEHIKKLGAAFLSQIAGTPADTGGFSKGFVTGGQEG